MVGTIKSSTEISYIFSHGKRYTSASLTILVLKDQQHGPQGRVAFIAGKKNGNAVWRNSAKRRMRAVCSELGGPWPGYDVVFLAKRRTTELSYSKVLNDTKKIICSFIS
ncbi:MAG: ribonuclease P protein component [Anaerotardibacter sp.]